MSIFRGDASEVYALAKGLSDVSAKAVPALRSSMTEAGKTVERNWRSDAARTHDKVARFYPDSIDSELVFDLGGVSVDIGPNEGKKQGFLGKILEFGGERSPAYLTGLQALDRSEPAVERTISQGLDPLFP